MYLILFLQCTTTVFKYQVPTYLLFIHLKNLPETLIELENMNF